MTDHDYVQSIADHYATNPAREAVEHRARLQLIARRLAAAQALADALEEICTALADDDECSARQIARHAGAETLAAWEQTR